MARKPTGNPTGRPNREYDKKIFEGLCGVWCTWEEMESILRTDRRTIDDWCKRTYDGENFSKVYNRFADTGKASLRRNQLKLSRTNAAMAIWLGKQKLRQSEDPNGANLQSLANLLNLIKENKLEELLKQKDPESE